MGKISVLTAFYRDGEKPHDFWYDVIVPAEKVAEIIKNHEGVLEMYASARNDAIDPVWTQEAEYIVRNYYEVKQLDANEPVYVKLRSLREIEGEITGLKRRHEIISALLQDYKGRTN